MGASRHNLRLKAMVLVDSRGFHLPEPDDIPICHELSQPITTVIKSSRILAGTRPEDRERAEKFMRIISEQGDLLEEKYKKLQNITHLRLQNYLDTQIPDLNESTGNIKRKASLPDHSEDDKSK